MLAVQTPELQAANTSPDVAIEIAASLGVLSVNSVDPLIRRDFHRGERVGGALVVRCMAAADCTVSSREIEINDENRGGLSEETIALLGAIADRRNVEGEYIHRVIC